MAMAETTVKPRKRLAKGPARPRYLESRDLDKMMIMLVALMAEVSALRDRLDSHEALADADQLPKTAAVEGYKLTDDRHARREELRTAMLKRVFRVLSEELEQIQAETLAKGTS
jgi:hypothetical protein